MIVIADTGPLNYLVLIGAVDVLQPLYARVIVPQAVVEELKRAGTPDVVLTWIRQPPVWFEVRPEPLQIQRSRSSTRARGQPWA